MKKLLYIDACIRDEQSRTKRIATPVIEALKNDLINLVIFLMSSIAQSSVDECIASCGRPISTDVIESLLSAILPRVEPPLKSLLLV